jgi:hypothetical protein
MHLSNKANLVLLLDFLSCHAEERAKESVCPLYASPPYYVFVDIAWMVANEIL